MSVLSFGKCAVLAAALLLAACDSAEDRAEQHFRDGMDRLAAGDIERAVVEFRNVFRLNPNLLEARLEFARAMRAHGDLPEAYRQYLFIVEQNPAMAEARVELARMALSAGDWEQAELHGREAIAIDATTDAARAIDASLRYRAAVVAEDAPARRQAAADARALIAVLPDDLVLRDAVIDNHIREGELSEALAELDAAMAAGFDEPRLVQLRLGLLSQLGDTAGVEAQLIAMLAADPANMELLTTLVRWHLGQGAPDKAEAVLRDRIDPAAPDPEAQVLLVRFLNDLKGGDAARAELDAMITAADAAGTDAATFRALRAGIDFDAGRQAEAVAEMEALVAGREPSAEVNNLKVALAQMLLATGNPVAARQRVEEVLANDPAQVEALKLRAAELIESDQGDAAIAALRQALDRAPNDPQLLTLMAEAHARNGSRDLSLEMLSLAVEASQTAPEESLRYAAALLAADRVDGAESVLVDALRITPGDIGLLTELGNIYIRQQDWARFDQVEATLRRQETDVAVAAANQLRLARLAAEQRPDEAIAFLEGMAVEMGDASVTAVPIVQAHFSAGRYDAALSFLDTRLAETPDDPTLRYLRAASLAALDRLDEAKALYRQLTTELPGSEPVWRALYALTRQTEGPEAAMALLREAMVAAPEAPNLRWALAGELEAAGDIDGAIAIYEELYAADTSNVIVANNLASLISAYREDPESLDRAWTIARRLRGVNVPQLQDTYGWIALRRGLVDEALEHLRPAALGLPGDPLVQYHLAVALQQAGDVPAAIAQYERALSVAGPADTRAQFERARTELAALRAAATAEGTDAPPTEGGGTQP
ncbi:MAG: tetratricopeptide repeat protein [Rhodobacteraceae bacterium]|nr:tetratricopeptide repeat protein [Paracoccaceae bacterium]